MLHMFKAIKDYIWSAPSVEDDLDARNKRLEKSLQILDEHISVAEAAKPKEIFRDCVKRSGRIELTPDSGGVIDGIFFTCDIQRPQNLKSGDTVQYLRYQKSEDHRPQVIQILSVVEDFFTGDDAFEETVNYDVANRVIISKVVERFEREVVISEKNIRFSLDNVSTSFVPMVGDWLELNVKAQLVEDTGCVNEDTIGAVLEVVSVKCLRSMVREGLVVQWDPENMVGIINNLVFFTKDACDFGYVPRLNDMVAVNAVESDQGKYAWRALGVSPLRDAPKANKQLGDSAPSTVKGIYITDSTSFGTLTFYETKTLTIEVHNRSSTILKFIDCYFLGKKCNSQMEMVSGKPQCKNLNPGASLNISFKCTPSFLGYSEETVAFKFQNVIINRSLKVLVEENNTIWSKLSAPRGKIDSYKTRTLKYLEHKKQFDQICLVRGVRMVKPPNFIAVRTPYYAIPKSMWNVYYDIYQHKNLKEADLVLGDSFPCILQSLSINNYAQKFHILLYLEEIESTLKLQHYDKMNAHLSRSGEYLCLEVEGLAENRPSLLVGDSVHVCFTSQEHRYEGIIHEIGGIKIYMKFASQFHQLYNGEDLQIHFSFNRSTYTKCHHAVDLAVDHFGAEGLFPNQLNIKPSQVNIVDQTGRPEEAQTDADTPKWKMRHIQWINTNLNPIQKMAVKNILQGVARPLPYVLFGPPGTGKTITLVETILQIFCLVPESRILVATPSNSSANLISERLIDLGDVKPGTLVRILSYSMLNSPKISEKLKPYCATLDISIETNKSANFKFRKVRKDGVQMNCQKSVIGRHRITVGTCGAIGGLYRLGFPRGHFTHIVVDEAGQAIEPELMIPLAFIDQYGGQAILAGDPMQLGPVIISHVSDSCGLGESYIERLLGCFPYRRDIHSFKGDLGGYDPRLVTRLTMNYRSIPRLLKLPSDMFYEGSLISQVNPDRDRIAEDVRTIQSGLEWSEEYPALVFHGVRGQNMQSTDSPSWYNLHEASMVMMYAVKLYNMNFTPDDIGIISPYLEQNRLIRAMFEDMELDLPKIGTVEDFQGQERKIILMSCVRSIRSAITCDVTYSLGFLKNPKRLNVSLTRAKILLFIFGNPHLLAIDKYWHKVIKHCIEYGKYMGCDLPKEFRDI